MFKQVNKTGLLIIVVLWVISVGVAEESEATAAGSDSYIVIMAQDPAIAYEGDLTGLPATKPGKGRKINPNSAHVRKYTKFLQSKHDKVLNNAGLSVNDKVHDYAVALNGFSAIMTEAQAAAMAKQDGVTLVLPDEMRHPEKTHCWHTRFLY